MTKETKTYSVLKKTVIGGVVVLLPVGIMLFIFRWFFGLITDIIQPITNLVIKSNGLPEIIGDIVVICMILAICFIVGWLVTTGAGRWFHSRFDSVLSRIAPGYRLVREIVNQFLGDDGDSPFSNGEVVLVQIFGKDNPVKVTAIVTSKSEKFVTVMFPTSPNPSSGLVYHLPWELVEMRPDIKIDSAMRTIIACGAGSSLLFGWTSLHQVPNTESTG